MKRLVFLHIPKTAGMTLRAVIRHNYPPDSVCEVERGADPLVPPQRLASVRAVVGHIPFGALGIEADTITLLRHPVDRLVSLYYYIRRRGPQHPLARYATDSLTEFASSELFEVHNDMTRLLSGLPGEPDAQHLETAVRNLRHGVAAFGTDDRFDESLLLFQQRLGWRTIHYGRENVTRRPSEIDAQARRILERNNELDLALWEAAARELAERIEAQPGGFHDALRAFRSRNRAYASLLSAGRRMPEPLRRLVRSGVRAIRAARTSS
jgi:hypothetical protein